MMRHHVLTFWIFAALALAAMPGIAAAQNDEPIDPTNATQLAREAEQAMADGEFERALELWEALRDRMPQSPQVPYNMGVAAYRNDDFERAAELFAQALSMTGDQKLRSDSAYNLGTSAYAQSLANDIPMVNPGANEQLDQASTELQRALEHYRQTLDISPEDVDARVNAELAYRRLQNLEAMKKQLQQTSPQQQQDQDQQQQEDQNENDQQQNQDQQNDQSQQQQDNPQQNPNEQQQQENQSDQPTSQSPADQQQQPQESPNEQPPDEDSETPSGGDQQDQEDQSAEPQPQQQPPSQPELDGMTRDEAERLLQMVRDKQRRRQEQKKRERASRLPPVDKDW